MKRQVFGFQDDSACKTNPRAQNGTLHYYEPLICHLT
jgi:hypothetical protein